MALKHISLATIRNGRIFNSFDEGSFDSVEEAKRAAEKHASEHSRQMAHLQYHSGESHIAVIVFGKHDAAPSSGDAILAKYPISRALRTSRQRCADCGEEGEMTGHQDCQYPQDH